MRMMRSTATLLALAGLWACDDTRAPDFTADGTPAAAERGDVGGADPGTGLSADFRAATNRILPAVVRVDVVSTVPAEELRGLPELFGLQLPDLPDQLRAGTGSGFIVDESGLVMTNRHVVEGADRVHVRLSDGREFAATVLGADPNTDIAVLRLDVPQGTELPVATLGDADDVAVGDWVLAVGSPLGLDFSVTAGIVSATGRSIGILARDGEAPLEAFIQTDAAINAGNSGGPLVDLNGRVIGINTAIESPTGTFAGYGFAVPIDVARKVASDLVEHGVVRRPRLGVQVADATAADAAVFDLPSVSGAVVRMVQDGTAAERAGIRLGDVVVTIDGEKVENASALTTTLAERQPGERLTLGLIRYGERLDVEVELEQFDMPEPRPRLARTGDDEPADPLGFTARPLTPQIARRLDIPADRGLVISGVQPLSAAAAAGVRPGQILRTIDGAPIETVEELERLRDAIRPGDAVSLVVEIGGEEVILNFIARS